MTFLVRRADASDAESIVQMVHELAAYEHYTGSVLLTAEHLAQKLDAAWLNPKIYARVASHKDEIVGYAMGFPCFSTYIGGWYFYVSDLYVKKEWRSQGAGRALLRSMAGLAHELGFPPLALDVLRRNTKAVKFYQRHGGVPHNETMTMWFEGETFDHLAG